MRNLRKEPFLVLSPLPNPTHRALQYLSDPLPLLHHVEVLPQVRRHVSLPDILRVVFIDAVEVPLLVRHRGRGRSSDHHLTGIRTHASALRMMAFTWKKVRKGEEWLAIKWKTLNATSKFAHK